MATLRDTTLGRRVLALWSLQGGPGVPRPLRASAPFGRLRTAKKISEILSGLNSRVVGKGPAVDVRLKRVDKRNLLWRFDAQGSKEVYTVYVKAVPADKRVTRLMSSDVLLACTCPYWRYQGPEYHAVKDKYLYRVPRGTAHPPDIMDVPRENFICKHVWAVLQIAKNYYVQ